MSLSERANRSQAEIVLDCETWKEMWAQCESIGNAVTTILAFLGSREGQSSVRSGPIVALQPLSQRQGAGVAFESESVLPDCERSMARPEWTRECCDRIGYTFIPEEPVDALCLEQAYHFVEVCLVSTVKQCAVQWDVPIDILEALVCDRFIFRRTGVAPLPIEWFVK
jgi:hypothetical protein